ncbi:MAG: enoyl-CoA hydratase-related protein [Rubrivivax sp.]
MRAVVITGAGDKAFCAGADPLQSGSAFRFDHSEPMPPWPICSRLRRRSTVPLIARVNGACMAGGMGLMAMCDMAVAAPHAIFGLPEMKVGLFPAQVMSVLGDLLPRRVLTQMCLTGEPISASRASTAASSLAVAEDLDAGLEAARQHAGQVAGGIRRGLYTLKAIEAMSFEESMRFTESQIALFALTDDAAEDELAFREKRAPNWLGR